MFGDNGKISNLHPAIQYGEVEFLSHLIIWHGIVFEVVSFLLE